MPSIIIHAIANRVGFSARMFVAEDDRVFDETIFEMYGGLTNLILVVTGSLIAIVACIHQLKNQFRKEDQ